MSLILVATVGGVLLGTLASVARRTDAWGYAGAEPQDTAGDGERADHRRVRPTIMPDAGPPPSHPSKAPGETRARAEDAGSFVSPGRRPARGRRPRPPGPPRARRSHGRAAPRRPGPGPGRRSRSSASRAARRP